MQIGDYSYIFLTAQRKAWHHNTHGWDEMAFERFSYVECGIYRKETARLNDRDRQLLESHGEEDEDFRWPDGHELPKPVFLPA